MVDVDVVVSRLHFKFLCSFPTLKGAVGVAGPPGNPGTDGETVSACLLCMRKSKTSTPMSAASTRVIGVRRERMVYQDSLETE